MKYAKTTFFFVVPACLAGGFYLLNVLTAPNLQIEHDLTLPHATAVSDGGMYANPLSGVRNLYPGSTLAAVDDKAGSPSTPNDIDASKVIYALSAPTEKFVRTANLSDYTFIVTHLDDPRLRKAQKLYAHKTDLMAFKDDPRFYEVLLSQVELVVPED